MADQDSEKISNTVPLCVDLDGTLTTDDTLWINLIHTFKIAPFQTLKCFILIIFGYKAKGKSMLASISTPRPETYLWNENVLKKIKAANAAKQPVWLVTAADQKIAASVNDFLGCFQNVIASNGEINAKGNFKIEAIHRETSKQPFDYIGNDSSDIPIFKQSRNAYATSRSDQFLSFAKSRIPDIEVLHHPAKERSVFKDTCKALRWKQWVKNSLLFVPIITAHEWSNPQSWFMAVVAFIAFCFAASSVYILNDILDMPNDRRHPSKKARPFAAGHIEIPHGLGILAVCLTLSIGISFFVNLSLTVLLCVYLVVNIFYSMHLKTLLLLDVYLLASFYTLRIAAGAVAIDVTLSNWLLTFSSFTFVSLGFLKRYSDLSFLKTKNQSIAGRAYQFDDTSFLLSLGIGTATAATITLALYVDYSIQKYIYANGNILWLICPLFFYAMSRLWLLACQGKELYDPVDFATHDKQTLMIVALMLLAVIFSI